MSSMYEVEVEGREQYEAWLDEQRAEARDPGELDAEAKDES